MTRKKTEFWRGGDHTIEAEIENPTEEEEIENIRKNEPRKVIIIRLVRHLDRTKLAQKKENFEEAFQ